MELAALQSGDLEAIKKTITENPDWVHSKDERGFSPLTYATYFNHSATINYSKLTYPNALIVSSVRWIRKPMNDHIKLWMPVHCCQV